MGWMIPMLLALRSTSDGGASSEPPPLFHEPMTRPVPLTKIDWSYPKDLLPNVRLQGVPPENQPRPLRPVVPENIAQACRGQNAQVCRDTAVAMLETDAGPADLDKASRLLGAACEQGVESACRTLEDAFEAPRMLEDLPPPRFPVRPEEGEVSCLISAQGRAHDCIGAPGPLREWAAASFQAIKFAPARYPGRPFETEHAIHYVVPVRK